MCEKESDDAMKIAFGLMKKMCEDKVEGNIATAAFACAWLWSMKFGGISPEEFSKTTDKLNGYYKEAWEKDKPYRESWKRSEKNVEA